MFKGNDVPQDIKGEISAGLINLMNTSIIIISTDKRGINGNNKYRYNIRCC